jgi:hypothetical protein
MWVRCPVELLRERLQARGRSQVAGKLAAFAIWTARMQPDVPPPVPHVAVEARAPDDALHFVLDALGVPRPATNLGS